MTNITKFIGSFKKKLCSGTNNFLVFSRNFTSDQDPVPQYLFFHNGITDYNEKLQLIKSMKVFENFITDIEENLLLQEINPHFSRMRYEPNHWDNAIKGYREIEKLSWDSSNSKIINKVRNLAFESQSVPIKYVHVLDLEETGVIMPHIDSIRFCGSTIAGLSLLSNSVMRLVHDQNKQKIVDVLLKRFSLYIMTGVARYDYTHEILANENSVFGNEVIKKTRRISIICRNEP